MAFGRLKSAAADQCYFYKMHYRLIIDYHKGPDPEDTSIERLFSGEVQLVVNLTRTPSQYTCGTNPTCPTGKPGYPPSDCTYKFLHESFTGTKCSGNVFDDLVDFYEENGQCNPVSPCAQGCDGFYQLGCEKTWHRCGINFILENEFNISPDNPQTAYGSRHIQLRHPGMQDSEVKEFAIAAWRILSLVKDWKESKTPTSAACYMCGLLGCLMYRGLFTKSAIFASGVGECFEDCVDWDPGTGAGAAGLGFGRNSPSLCQHDLAQRWKRWILVDLLTGTPIECAPAQYNPVFGNPIYTYEDVCPFCCDPAAIGPGTGQ
jgi:hypothetical protein